MIKSLEHKLTWAKQIERRGGIKITKWVVLSLFMDKTVFDL